MTRADGPREVRRRQRIELSREQILDTAEQLFSERGYHATGLKDVAERCEFSVGSIYQFFDSKDALYEEVLMRYGPGMSDGMAAIVASAGPADQQLLAMARHQVGHFRTYPAWGRLTTRVLTLGIRPATELPLSFLAAFKAAIDLEARLFARGQAEGVLRGGDPRALARLFSSMVSAFHAMDPHVSDDPEDFSAAQFLDLIEHTFVVRPLEVRAAVECAETLTIRAHRVRHHDGLGREVAERDPSSPLVNQHLGVRGGGRAALG